MAREYNEVLQLKEVPLGESAYQCNSLKGTDFFVNVNINDKGEKILFIVRGYGFFQTYHSTIVKITKNYLYCALSVGQARVKYKVFLEA